VSDDGRFVILGASGTRARWFTEVGGWATGGAAPIEFVRCVSVSEVIGRIRGGARASAVLVDATAPGVDRELSACCERNDVALVRVGDPRPGQQAGGADGAVLPPSFGVDELLTTLQSVARPVRWRTLMHATALTEDPTPRSDVAYRGRLTAVCGRGGAGASVTAMAIAQHLAADDVGSGSVLLADLARNGDLGCYHDAPDVVPALQELVDLHRHGTAGRSAVESMLHDVPERGYSLLLGLRRSHDWVALAPAAIEATLASLRSSFRHVVADVTADFEDEALTGSVDVEERNALARLTVVEADTVVAVGRDGVKGIRDLVRLLDDLVAAGAHPERIVPVVTRAPRDRAGRAEIARALGDLCASPPDVSPVFVPTLRRLEAHLRCADPLPAALCRPAGRAVFALGEVAPGGPVSDSGPGRTHLHTIGVST
jgi:hypothetical protein